jgi:tetratricopeptide (TPR) repeat protein
MILVLLVFSGYATWTTLKLTPAFNPNLMGETLLGNGRIPMSRSMFDKGEYDFQRGYGFLMSDRIVSPYTEQQGEIASPEVARQRARKAQDAFEAALSVDPGNAHAWTSLAWTHARLGNADRSISTLRVSWGISPNSNALAQSRISLANFLANPDVGKVALIPSDYEAISRDLNVLRLHAPGAFARFSRLFPYLLRTSNSSTAN